MLKKILLKLLLKIYCSRNREVEKISPSDEFRCYKFKDEDDVLLIIKSRITRLTIKYFEATTELERNIIKGACLELKSIKDNHELAQKLRIRVGENDKAIEQWKKIRII